VIRLFTILWIFILCTCSSPETKPKTKDIREDSLALMADLLVTTHLDSAMSWALRVYSTVNDGALSKGIAARVLGEAYYQKGYFDRANAYLIEALPIIEEKGSLTQLAKINSLLGRVYQYSKSFDLALEHYRRALRTYMTIQDQNGMAESFGNIGHFYEKKARYDSALYYQQRAMGIYQSLNDKSGQAKIFDNIGSIHEDLGDFNKALPAFERAYRINTLLGNETEALVNRNNIGDVFRKTGQFEKALTEMKKVLRLAKKLDQPYQIRSAYRDMGKIYSGMENTYMAYAHLDSAYAMTDDIYSAQIAREMASARAIYDLKQKEQQIALLQKDKKIGNVLRIGLMAGIVLIGIIGGLVYIQQRTRIKKNRKLYEAEKAVARANEEKLKAELQFNKVVEEKLQQEVESKSRELTTNALHIIQKNEFLENLKKELKEIGTTESDKVNKQLKKIRKSIDYNFNLDDDWQEFEAIFQQVHHDFFLELKKAYPYLTSAEIRLCAMLRLNMSSKDMATVLGISQDSLRIARYRLRKKLELDKGANLYSYIMGIG